MDNFQDTKKFDFEKKGATEKQADTEKKDDSKKNDNSKKKDIPTSTRIPITRNTFLFKPQRPSSKPADEIANNAASLSGNVMDCTASGLLAMDLDSGPTSLNNNSTPLTDGQKEVDVKRPGEFPTPLSLSTGPKRIKFVDRIRVPLADRPRDKDVNIKLLLGNRYPDLMAKLRLPIQEKPEKNKMPHLPDQIWQKIFGFAAQQWQKHSIDFHMIVHERDVSVWQGCHCCLLPEGLHVNQQARDATLDVMRAHAIQSDGKNHVVRKVVGPYTGVVLPDFAQRDVKMMKEYLEKCDIAEQQQKEQHQKNLQKLWTLGRQ